MGILVAAKPRLLADRFSPPAVVSEDFRAITISLAFGIAIALVALGSVPLLRQWLRGEVARRWVPAVACAVAFLALASCLADWMTYAVVASVGEQLVDLGTRLGIEDPVLAHHDAGGTSYKARIKLLDLGGLGNRTIAKHMNSSTFLSHYILDEVKPDFIFGSSENFAAGRAHFWQLPEFHDRYVPVEFAGKPYMKSGLCHVQRDRLIGTQAPGVEVEGTDGKIAKVLVR